MQTLEFLKYCNICKVSSLLNWTELSEIGNARRYSIFLVKN